LTDVSEIENLYAQMVIQVFDDLRDEDGDGAKYISRNYLGSGDYWIPYFCSLLEGVRIHGCIAGNPAKPKDVTVSVPTALDAVILWAEGSLDDFDDDGDDCWQQRAFNLNLKRFLDNVYLRGDRTLTAFTVLHNSGELEKFCKMAGLGRSRVSEVIDLAETLSETLVAPAVRELRKKAEPIRSRMVARLYRADAELTTEDGS
jgi:hypothetical protein